MNEVFGKQPLERGEIKEGPWAGRGRRAGALCWGRWRPRMGCELVGVREISLGPWWGIEGPV